MDKLYIDQLIQHNAFPDVSTEVQLIETHISWVILTQNFAFKIKKEICYSFLDFSTLEKRKFYCDRELELNQRLTEDMYLKVVPIRIDKGLIAIEGKTGEIIDYALKMRRMDESRQMNLLLEAGEVTKKHMIQIADKLSVFHAFTDVVQRPPDIAAMQEDFADILNVKAFIKKHLGPKAAEKIEEAVAFSKTFLKEHTPRILERHQMGFTIDGHGDLHSKNIFLLDKPVIFDCIEFNDHFRQLDVLNEIAFFCMDLNFYKREDLEAFFLHNYLIKYPCLFNEQDHQLFRYFKFYRANIKVKVNALKAIQATSEKEFGKRLDLTDRYFVLLRRYLGIIEANVKVSH